MPQPQTTDLLKRARTRYSQREIAALLDVDIRTVRRWETRETDPPPYLADAIRQRVLPFAAAEQNATDSAFTFVDLFAGIGGIRLGFAAHGGRCVFTGEWNTFAQKTYLENFRQDSSHIFVGDITTVDEKDVDTQAYQQFGQVAVASLTKEVARIMLPQIVATVSRKTQGKADVR